MSEKLTLQCLTYQCFQCSSTNYSWSAHDSGSQKWALPQVLIKRLKLSRDWGFYVANGYLDYAMELNLLCCKTKTQWLTTIFLITYLFVAYLVNSRYHILYGYRALTTNFEVLLVSLYLRAFLPISGNNFCISPCLMNFMVGRYVVEQFQVSIPNLKIIPTIHLKLSYLNSP